MKAIPTVALKRVATREVADKITDDYLTNSHYKYLFTRSARVIDHDTGEVVIVFVKQEIPADIWQAAHEPLNKVNKVPKNRGSAIAGKGSMMYGLKKDGKLSPYKRVDEELLRIAGNPLSDFLGFFDYENGCRETEWTLRDPEIFGEAVQALMRWVNARYAYHLPDDHALQAAEIAKIREDLVIPGTLYTTLTDNKGVRTTAHRDTGDLSVGKIALTCTRADAGGELIIPEYSLAVDYKPGDILFMDSHLLHGNAAFDGARLTQVMYTRERMHLCEK
jgi:hypothetical protein